MEKYAMIVAGGSGIRMGGDIPKQYQLLKGKPVLWYSIKAFVDAFNDIQIILVIPAIYTNRTETIIKEFPGRKICITTGGENRFHSVKNGLSVVKEKSIVFVHDAVRCLVSTQLIQECYKVALDKGNAVPAVSATDTIRLETSGGNKQVDRNKIKIIQTPQVFYSDALIAAYKQDYHPLFTDEAGVIESTGVKINLIEGEVTNIKITRPVDLLIAEKILEERGTK
jgi:2-C-methyl-D-erythritol 4-phosphate cytidylyltransferase